jgi:hypothetical protein
VGLLNHQELLFSSVIPRVQDYEYSFQRAGAEKSRIPLFFKPKETNGYRTLNRTIPQSHD